MTPMIRLPFGANHPSDVLDMPVDPNEPTYCTCHQVSYGEMIGCDNQDVSSLKSLSSLKWFLAHNWIVITFNKNNNNV